MDEQLRIDDLELPLLRWNVVSADGRLLDSFLVADTDEEARRRGAETWRSAACWTHLAILRDRERRDAE